MSSTPSGSTLPVLALPHPLILLPTGRITIPVSKAVGEALLALVRESDEQPLIAAVPQTASPEAALYAWGTASRIVRLIRPATGNLKQHYLLSLNGIARVRVLDSNPDLPVVNTGITYRTVEYPSAAGPPSPEAVVKFKGRGNYAVFDADAFFPTRHRFQGSLRVFCDRVQEESLDTSLV